MIGGAAGGGAGRREAARVGCAGQWRVRGSEGGGAGWGGPAAPLSPPPSRPGPRSQPGPARRRPSVRPPAARRGRTMSATDERAKEILRGFKLYPPDGEREAGGRCVCVGGYGDGRPPVARARVRPPGREGGCHGNASPAGPFPVASSPGVSVPPPPRSRDRLSRLGRGRRGRSCRGAGPASRPCAAGGFFWGCPSGRWQMAQPPPPPRWRASPPRPAAPELSARAADGRPERGWAGRRPRSSGGKQRGAPPSRQPGQVKELGGQCPRSRQYLIPFPPACAQAPLLGKEIPDLQVQKQLNTLVLFILLTGTRPVGHGWSYNVFYC